MNVFLTIEMGFIRIARVKLLELVIGMARGKRVAAERSNNSLNQLQQLQLQFAPNGEVKALQPPKTFSISDCSDDW